MSLLTSSVGRKVLMAITGLFMVLFVIVHLLGNSSAFLGPDGINAYAEKLRSLGPLVWIFRAFMCVMLCLHVYFGIILTLENSAANPARYAVRRKLKASFAGETMIWTGLLLLAFLVYHLLQFTFRVTPDVVLAQDAKGRFDVFGMITGSFRRAPVSAIYIAAMVVLFLHLSHGIQSFVQTLGCNNDRTLPRFQAVGRLLSVLFFLGYSAIPVLILAGILAK